jgi:hypothetical protein
VDAARLDWYDDHPTVRVEIVLLGGARRGKPPLKHVALNHHRALQFSVALALLDRPDIDHQRTCCHGGLEIFGGHPIETRACLSEELIHGRHRASRKLRPPAPAP